MKVCACQKRPYHKFWHSFKHPTQKIYLQFLENIAQTWKRKELRNGYKISDLDIYANIHECTKLHKHKLIQGRHSLRNAAPKCSLRSPMSRNVCFKHVQHPMKSVLSNFNYHSSQTSNEILPLKLQSNILHPMRILLSFAQKVLAQISW